MGVSIQEIRNTNHLGYLLAIWGANNLHAVEGSCRAYHLNEGPVCETFGGIFYHHYVRSPIRLPPSPITYAYACSPFGPNVCEQVLLSMFVSRLTRLQWAQRERSGSDIAELFSQPSTKKRMSPVDTLEMCAEWVCEDTSMYGRRAIDFSMR